MPEDFPARDGRYRARDLWLVPNLVSFVRVPLALIFPWVSRQAPLALAVLVAAAASDVVDGYLARRLRQSTALGAVLDGAIDKLFAAMVAASLLWQHRLSLSEAGLLFARELMELPLVVWWGLDRTQRHRKLSRHQANWLGKVATLTQFVALAAILSSSGPRASLIAITGGCGALAAASYWSRELDATGRRAQRNG